MSSVVHFRIRFRAAVSAATLWAAQLCAPAFACSGMAHIEIKDAGVYAIDYAAVVAAQPALKDCHADDLFLLDHGQEIPIRVDAASPDFKDGDHIVWVGGALHGPESWFDQYSAVNVYQLGASSGSHARLREPNVAVSNSVALQRTLHFEQENLMLRVSQQEMRPGEEPDVWQWAKLTPIDLKPFATSFDLPDLDARAAKEPVRFTFALRGMSNVIAKPKQTKPIDHVVEISINGKALPSLSWDGRAEFRKMLDVPASALKDKGNEVVVRVVKRDQPDDATNFIVDVVMFNWFEAAYPIRDRLEDLAAPFRVEQAGASLVQTTNASTLQVFGSDGTQQNVDAKNSAKLAPNVDYFAIADNTYSKPLSMRPVVDDAARSTKDGFDYLIVAHSRLLAAIEPLAQFHRNQGMKVAVYNVDDVYDDFNGGIVHPRAIRDLVEWGTQHWTTKPKYLLLVGDASFDIHHDQRVNRPDKHMYAARVNPPPEEMTQANGFGALGSTSYANLGDELPNRNLIPTWQYPTFEGQSASDNPFVALDQNDVHPKLAVGRFPVVRPEEVKAIVDKTIRYLTSAPSGEWQRDVTFVSTSEVASFKSTSDEIAKQLVGRGFSVNNVYSNFEEKDVARYTSVRETLKHDLDGGNLLVHFIGHGGQYIWRVGPIGDLFSLDDVGALKNIDRYPMVLAMTCFSAPFDHPTEDSIGEKFLREADKGAVAVFAASWSNWPNPENSKSLVEALLTPGRTIGDAIVSVKAKTQDPVLVEMYNLLGDPAIRLVQPQGKLAFQRAASRWDSRIVVRIPAPSFGGDVDVDWLDAAGNTISSQHYQARDTTFSLPFVAKADRARFYVRDARDGFSAFGTADLKPPPVKPAPPPPTPVRAMPKKLPRVRNPKDDIAELDFDAAPPPQKH